MDRQEKAQKLAHELEKINEGLLVAAKSDPGTAMALMLAEIKLIKVIKLLCTVGLCDEDGVKQLIPLDWRPNRDTEDDEE